MQYRIQCAEKDGDRSGLGDLAEMTSKFDFLKTGLSSGADMQRTQREIQSVHEQEMQTLQMSMKKLEKELGYKDEEVRHFKNMASQAAEKYEKCERTIRQYEITISEKDKDNDRLEGRIVELEVRIGKLNTEKFELCQEFAKKDQEKQELNKKVADLYITIQSQERNVVVSKTEIDESRDAMKQMQLALMKKGEENQRLSETVNQIKNQILEEQIFDQRFIVQQVGALSTTDYIVSTQSMQSCPLALFQLPNHDSVSFYSLTS